MGAKVILDIIGSTIIGGILITVMLNMKANQTENYYRNSSRLILQENIILLTEMLDNDFKQISYLRDQQYQGNPIEVATRNRIRFTTDIKPNMNNNPDGVSDRIEYNFTGTDAGTPNPRDTVLTRTVTTSDANFNQSGAVTNLNFGITKFTLTYFDNLGNKLSSTPADRTQIVTIQIDIMAEVTNAYGGSTSDYNKETVRWRRTYSRNQTIVR